ncbi:MAG: prenyltransferase [Nitrososphaerales archaeon]|nr:prenyltransferase [Nitrososphaerales archaeon]
MSLRVWFLETRPQFLLLSIVLVFLGTSVAVYEGYFNLTYFFLALVGLLLLHISVNILNDYFDFKSGIDMETKRTPFSGGSGILPAGLLKPSSVYKFGVVCLLSGLLIGAFFTIVRGLLLLPIIVIGAISVYFYTTHFAKYMVGELFAGLGMGALPVLGAYFVQSGGYTLLVIVASIPPLILTHNLLFLNEFPDVEPDKKGGRKNLVMVLGKERASKVYSILTIAVYCWIVAWIGMGLIPLPALLSLMTAPIAIKAINGSLKNYSDLRIVPALGANVIVVLATQALLGVGFLVASFLTSIQ